MSLGVLLCMFLETSAPGEVATVLKTLDPLFAQAVRERADDNPVDVGMEAGMRRRLSTGGKKEVLKLKAVCFVGVP